MENLLIEREVMEVMGSRLTLINIDLLFKCMFLVFQLYF
ncbi:hypothetical protein BuS5_02780 [Desulfosarcina sp. BuS5]|nr:hypothetical protein BuS5_02780 [Desulfosarcina sp. BuS5]